MFQTEVEEKIRTHILCSIIFPPGNRAVYEMVWRNMSEPNRLHLTLSLNALALHGG
jgi:hypothetical protein